MSGGSYEYMHSDMANGEVEKFVRYHEALVDDLEKVLNPLREGTLTEYDAANLRHVPFREQAAATEAMQCVIAKVRYAEELLGRLGEMMRSLADVAHAVEWWQSSDTGPDDVANACLAWLQKRRYATPLLLQERKNLMLVASDLLQEHGIKLDQGELRLLLDAVVPNS